MDSISFFCLDNSELAEYEAISRGFRSDIYVEISGEHYQLNIYDSVRLKQDFDTEIEDYGVFSIEPNVVLVKEVNIEEIKKTVINLLKQKYFKEIKPLNVKEIESLDLVKL